MAHVDLEDSWVVVGDLDSAEVAVRNYLKLRHMRIVDRADDAFQFEQGSWFLTRLLGGWFVPAAWLPKVGSITLRETKEGLRLRAAIEDSLGFGIVDPLLKGKYERFFHDFIDGLHDWLHTE